MARKRFLPKYVTSFVDRHGKERLRFRRKGYQAHYFSSPLGTEEFLREYRTCLDGVVSPPDAALNRVAPGSINDLIVRYFAVPSRLGPTLTTQAKVRSIIDKFRRGRGDRSVAAVRFDHIESIVARKMIKVEVNGRPEGGIEAARKLRKELIRLFDFAVKIGMRSDNPVRQTDRIRLSTSSTSSGFHTWTEAEITQYRNRHPLGGKSRLAMELMLWTGQRRGDAIRMGPKDIVDERIRVTQSKTGKQLWLPLSPQLREAINSLSRTDSHSVFLLTERGKPFTNPGFGNWFRDQCNAAGLPHCTAHGLRKATMRRMAELGLSQQSLKAVSGHTRDEEVSIYTRAADQKRMADIALESLSDWEMSNLPKKLDTSSRKGS